MFKQIPLAALQECDMKAGILRLLWLDYKKPQQPPWIRLVSVKEKAKKVVGNGR